MSFFILNNLIFFDLIDSICVSQLLLLSYMAGEDSRTIYDVPCEIIPNILGFLDLDSTRCLSETARMFRNEIGNEVVVLVAVKWNSYAMMYASKDLMKDQNFVIAAIKQNGHALRFVSKDLQSNREVVLGAVKQYGRTLEYASKNLRNDRELQEISWGLRV